jgi:hypothetical protein
VLINEDCHANGNGKVEENDMKLNIPAIMTPVRNMEERLAVAIMCGLLCFANLGDAVATDGRNDDSNSSSSSSSSNSSSNAANNVMDEDSIRSAELNNIVAMLDYIGDKCTNQSATIYNLSCSKDSFLKDFLDSDSINNVESNVKATSYPPYAELAKNVVRVSCLTVDKESEQVVDVEIGTGTLIDLGIPSLEGRVVLTAQHCFGWYTGGEYGEIKIAHHNDGTFPKKMSNLNCKVYLSVQTGDNSDIINTVNKHNMTDYKIIRFYRIGETAVAILNKPIVNGENNKAIKGLVVPHANNCEAEWSSTMRYGDKTPNNCIDFAIGYGWSGMDAGPWPSIIRYDSFKNVLKLVGNQDVQQNDCCFIGATMEFAYLTGWNRKKVVDISTRPVTENTTAPNTTVTVSDVSIPKAIQDVFIRNNKRAGGGFSGSIVMELPINANDTHMLRWLGMVSGESAKNIVSVLSYVAVIEACNATGIEEKISNQNEVTQLIKSWSNTLYTHIPSTCIAVLAYGVFSIDKLSSSKLLFDTLGIPSYYKNWWNKYIGPRLHLKR